MHLNMQIEAIFVISLTNPSPPTWICNQTLRYPQTHFSQTQFSSTTTESFSSTTPPPPLPSPPPHFPPPILLSHCTTTDDFDLQPNTTLHQQNATPNSNTITIAAPLPKPFQPIIINTTTTLSTAPHPYKSTLSHYYLSPINPIPKSKSALNLRITPKSIAPPSSPDLQGCVCGYLSIYLSYICVCVCVSACVHASLFATHGY